MSDCLICDVKPRWKCLNCNRRICDDCRTSKSQRKVRCPDRPLYGQKDGHYLAPMEIARPILLMPRPKVVKVDELGS